ncbi:endoglucanase 24-like isoform X1 [Zingiber officinale]|uniref:endoglucanase 24-like isoform X1 n=1 Tax=Zingiber officinale TaxID=94328 RepID=UPI001C4CA2A9|nr:endoglucanase 24-like isoform X1 [Zingiber officinale]XP_042429894.1 endoglucanase 24-like isoform X1 [Zingiber officinale]XP_042429895.1 endoglucanase 24-like isoform X1 [Zingiber officinale]
MGAKYTRGCTGWLIVLVVAALVVAAVVFAVVKKHRHRDVLPVPGPPGSLDQKYADALGVALQFFQVQKCMLAGKLVDNKITWRGDSALDDGNQAGLDLSKGMYDAGDHMKFGFPMAYTATVLSWSILEYGDQMSTAKQLDPALDALKWITDYLINAHPSDNVLFVQVGDPDIDHKCWERAETMAENRPLTQINKTAPGSDVAAETAAAMAAASLVFKSTDSRYSDLLLQHAKKLFTFANNYRGIYSDSIPKVQNFYNSTGYGDELLWAASWLYHATGDQSYLDYVTVKNGNSFADWGRPTWFSWDDKRAGTQVLLSRVHFFGSRQLSSGEMKDLQSYRETAEAVICGLLPDSPTATSSRTEGGLVWIDEWDALQHPVAASFLAVVYSDYMLTSSTPKIQCSGKTFTPSDLRSFATSQVDYILGDNPMKLSYLVGYGNSYPQQVHHRGASIPADATTGCNGFQWLSSTEPNPNVAQGALVGGPFKNDSYIDLRNNSMQSEPSTYNSAALVGLLSGLVTTSSVSTSFR